MPYMTLICTRCSSTQAQWRKRFGESSRKSASTGTQRINQIIMLQAHRSCQSFVVPLWTLHNYDKTRIQYWVKKWIITVREEPVADHNRIKDGCKRSSIGMATLVLFINLKRITFWWISQWKTANLWNIVSLYSLFHIVLSILNVPLQ